MLKIMTCGSVDDGKSTYLAGYFMRQTMYMLTIKTLWTQ